MAVQITSLLFLVFAIVLGYMRKLNVGIVSLGLALILAKIGGVSTGDVLNGFPHRLFLTLLGTMLFFSLLQENKTLEAITNAILRSVGKRAFLIPIIIYLVSFVLSAAGPGAISVQAVTVVFAVSLAVQMKASPVLMGSMAILGAVGGTASPIALTGIIVRDLAADMPIENLGSALFIGISVVNFICALVVYFVLKGHKLQQSLPPSAQGQTKEALNRKQLLSLVATVVLIVMVVGFQWDVGLVCFTLSLLLILFGASNEKSALKIIPWGTLILICGVSVLMNVTKKVGGIDLLSDLLSRIMNGTTAAPLLGLTGGIMSWFSSANGVVFPTLIPAAPSIAQQVGSGVSVLELIIAVVAAATVAGISPLSTGGSLIMASYTREADVDEGAQQKLFGKLFAISALAVVVTVLFAFTGFYRVL